MEMKISSSIRLKFLSFEPKLKKVLDKTLKNTYNEHLINKGD